MRERRLDGERGKIRRGSIGWLKLVWEDRIASIQVISGPDKNGTGLYTIKLLDGVQKGRTLRVKGNRIQGVG